MTLLSINVGEPREVEWNGEVVTTGIFKSPVPGPVAVRRLNMDGDRQADLTVHGGIEKAVYAYPGEHYAYWRAQLPEADLGMGAFGENLTTEGLLETDVAPGDRLQIGGAHFVVTKPRMPCYKLQIRFERLDIVKRFWRSGRSGFYLAVEREGEVAVGDAIRFTPGTGRRVTIAEAFAARSARPIAGT
jgi:MOSC domain-containing protein YiiM